MGKDTKLNEFIRFFNKHKITIRVYLDHRDWNIMEVAGGRIIFNEEGNIESYG